MIAFSILILGLAFCIYLFIGGNSEDEVINRYHVQEEGEKDSND